MGTYRKKTKKYEKERIAFFYGFPILEEKKRINKGLKL